MATDTKTTAERMAILINASDTLRQTAKLCADAQKYHDNCSDFANRGPNVIARMATIKQMITDISNELAELATDANMAFQFEWVAGRNGIYDITVLSASSAVCLHYAGGTVIDNAFSMAVQANDVIRLKDSTLNSQYLTVLSVAAGAGYLHMNSGVQNETLLSRVIKEMD